MAKKTKELENKTKVTTTKNSNNVKNKTTERSNNEKQITTKSSNNTKKISTQKKSNTHATTKSKNVPKKNTHSKKIKTNAEETITSKFQTEYYDLPHSYNKTIVKILAQTPNMLFVYWEINETDIKNLKILYGEKFFEETKPVLIIYNTTMNYSFEIEINDFANSWYIHINDSNCNYTIELGRKSIQSSSGQNIEKSDNNTTQHIPYYVFLSSSNRIKTPNNHILYEFKNNSIKFKNIKTNKTIHKNINNSKFYTNMKIINIKQLYKNLFNNENFEYETFLNNSSSRLSS